MEFALDLYATGGRNQTALMVAQMEIGEILLDEVGRLEGKTSDATRWEWAIGQQALSDGQFHGARVLLTRACQRYRHQPALLVACGTVHETFASFNISSAAVLEVVGVMTPTTSEPSTEALLRFRATRKDDLKGARDAFEEAVPLELPNAEASLRLGKVRLEQGDLDGAAKALESLVRLKTDLRITYLSRLFLGRVREKQKRFDEAIRC
jgi:tetratricopeptide (TPR) repeat protein